MYRDLKFLNILIGMENYVIIGDFGFVRFDIMFDVGGIFLIIEKDRVCFLNNLGIFFYMVLEIRILRVYDRKVDLYSFGMIFFEMYYKMGFGMERI